MAWSAKSYLLAEVVPRFAPGCSYMGACWVLGAISWHRYSLTSIPTPYAVFMEEDRELDVCS